MRLMFPAARVVWLEQTEEPLTDIKCVTCRVKLGITRWLNFVEYFFFNGTILKVLGLRWKREHTVWETICAAPILANLPHDWQVICRKCNTERATSLHLNAAQTTSEEKWRNFNRIGYIHRASRGGAGGGRLERLALWHCFSLLRGSWEAPAEAIVRRWSGLPD